MRRSQSSGRSAGGPRSTAAGCVLRILKRAALGLVAILTSTATGQAQTPEILYRFGDSSSGPASAALLEAADGHLYGASAGRLFRMSRAGQITILHRLRSDTAGSGPAAPLIQARDGSIYGTTRFDGPLGTFRGGGTVFRWDQDGSFHVLHGFGAIGDVASPGPLIQGADGNFYGIADLYRDASGEMRSTGAVYRMTPAGVVTVLHVFVGGASDGDQPTSLIQGADGFFYGTTRFGGSNSGGHPIRGPNSGSRRGVSDDSGRRRHAPPRVRVLSGPRGAGRRDHPRTRRPPVRHHRVRGLFGPGNGVSAHHRWSPDGSPLVHRRCRCGWRAHDEPRRNGGRYTVRRDQLVRERGLQACD